jgi:DNA-binding HxlR family transcriptional regulator
MVKKSFSDMDCSLAQALDIIGEWWSMLIVRDFFLGNGVRRFEQLRDSLGISRNILTERLKTLTEAGVIERVPLQKGGKRCAYQLTRKGHDLLPTMMAMMQWGEKYADGSMSPGGFIKVRERVTGDEIAPLSIQNQAGAELGTADLYLTVNGPNGEEKVREWPIDWHKIPDPLDKVS